MSKYEPSRNPGPQSEPDSEGARSDETRVLYALDEHSISSGPTHAINFADRESWATPYSTGPRSATAIQARRDLVFTFPASGTRECFDCVIVPVRLGNLDQNLTDRAVSVLLFNEMDFNRLKALEGVPAGVEAYRRAGTLTIRTAHPGSGLRDIAESIELGHEHVLRLKALAGLLAHGSERSIVEHHVDFALQLRANGLAPDSALESLPERLVGHMRDNYSEREKQHSSRALDDIATGLIDRDNRAITAQANQLGLDLAGREAEILLAPRAGTEYRALETGELEAPPNPAYLHWSDAQRVNSGQQNLREAYSAIYRGKIQELDPLLEPPPGHPLRERRLAFGHLTFEDLREASPIVVPEHARISGPRQDWMRHLSSSGVALHGEIAWTGQKAGSESGEFHTIFSLRFQTHADSGSSHAPPCSVVTRLVGMGAGSRADLLLEKTPQVLALARSADTAAWFTLDRSGNLWIDGRAWAWMKGSPLLGAGPLNEASAQALGINRLSERERIYIRNRVLPAGHHVYFGDPADWSRP